MRLLLPMMKMDYRIFWHRTPHVSEPREGDPFKGIISHNVLGLPKETNLVAELPEITDPAHP
jgi:hypothetical protein